MQKKINSIYILRNPEILNETGQNIPLHPNLSYKDMDYIINTIKDFGKDKDL